MMPFISRRGVQKALTLLWNSYGVPGYLLRITSRVVPAAGPSSIDTPPARKVERMRAGNRCGSVGLARRSHHAHK